VSDEQNRRAHAQLQRELAELDTPRARYQAQLDRLWWERHAADENVVSSVNWTRTTSDFTTRHDPRWVLANGREA
jgi:hypothetical protein